jgi:hypothetical protein
MPQDSRSEFLAVVITFLKCFVEIPITNRHCRPHEISMWSSYDSGACRKQQIDTRNLLTTLALSKIDVESFRESPVRVSKILLLFEELTSTCSWSFWTILSHIAFLNLECCDNVIAVSVFLRIPRLYVVRIIRQCLGTFNV